MAVCSACGKELPGEFPFCPFCAAPLTAEPASSPLEERKVVSVLFCDLVGFTAASDARDPEDVRARLRPYHARLREEVERFGGMVEKFIGDAVMAVFRRARGVSSAGRAPPLQGGGHRFDPDTLHLLPLHRFLGCNAGALRGQPFWPPSREW
jgi:hypothetical protein